MEIDEMYSHEIKTKTADTCDVVIYIAGDYDRAREICREHCDSGGCVSLQRIDYIYTGDEETGVAVRFINYPRFPRSEDQLMHIAVELGKKLIRGLYQSSCTVIGPTQTIWLSRRPEE